MYKSILVQVDADDPASATRVQFAADLAKTCSATLIGAAASLPEPVVEMLASGGAAIAAGVLTEEQDDLARRFAASKAAFDQAMSGAGVAAEWRTTVDFPALAFEALAARADLIVTGPSQTSSAANGYFDYGDLVMRAGRPVMSVPRGVARLGYSIALVAWRNTPEARRALVDAVPLLGLYRAVVLVHVCEGAERTDPSLADAQAFLRGHDVPSTTRVVDVDRRGPAAAIAAAAADAGADLIVAGAYGHTRLREWVFGGVTRELFRGSRVACLLSR
jgi:nucleotide-binding universal stress UspA family protein